MNRSAKSRVGGLSSGDALRATLIISFFAIFQIACQLLLMVETLGSMRVVMRSIVFLVSIGLLIFLPGREQSHPAKPWMLAALIVVALSIFRSDTNSSIAGIAHFLLYVAIAAPIFWVTRLQITEAGFRNVVMCLWAFHIASAAVGVLQMHYPGRFQPGVSAAVRSAGELQEGLKIRLADGTQVWRPMGLTDTPGGAAGAGLYAIVFSLGMYLQNRMGLIRLLSVMGFGVGFFCLYMGQIRSLLVMAVICVGVLIAILSRRGELGRYFELAILLPFMAVLSFFWAARIGGQDTVDRMSSIVKDGRVDEVYQQNRGHFLTHTVTELLPEFPLGAGLGRWGMMRGYFGDESNLNSPMIWVEIQWTGWLLDGGIPLIVFYSTAIGVTTIMCYRIAVSRRLGRVSLWGALLFSLNIASVALLFNYPLFIGQGGMEFWFLNASLYMMVVTSERTMRAAKAAAAANAAHMRTRAQSQPAESMAHVG